MKKLSLAIFIIGAIALFSFKTASVPPKSGGIKFFSGKFQQALNKAKTENKLVFWYAHASWCEPCKKMAKEVFTNKSVAKYFNKNFINISMDMEKGEAPVIVKKYPLSAYPTLLFIDAKGDVVTQAMGVQDAKQLLELGELAKSMTK